jgi:hypothetical protein
MYHVVPRIAKTTRYIMLAGEFSNVTMSPTLTQIQIRRFSDQDLLMRYHWGLGVGHLHVHGSTSTSSCILDKSIDTSDDLFADPEPLGGRDMHATDMDSSASYESDNSEMALEDRDLEGWEDVEGDTSDDGNDIDHDSEDDYGGIYE